MLVKVRKQCVWPKNKNEKGGSKNKGTLGKAWLLSTQGHPLPTQLSLHLISEVRIVLGEGGSGALQGSLHL